MIITLLGILKAGGAYVALHPDLPKARLAHQLSTVKPPLLITQEALLDRLPESVARLCVSKRSRRRLFSSRSQIWKDEPRRLI